MIPENSEQVEDGGVEYTKVCLLCQQLWRVQIFRCGILSIHARIEDRGIQGQYRIAGRSGRKDDIVNIWSVYIRDGRVYNDNPTYSMIKGNNLRAPHTHQVQKVEGVQ